MPDGQHGVDEQHAGAALAHNGADLLTHFGLVSSFHYIVLFWGGLLQRCVTRVLSGTARA